MAKARKKKLSAKGRLLLIVFVLTAFVFNATTILLFLGMMPTIAARLVDRTPERTKVLTVGFMNFAGCFPFWFQLVQKGHTLGAVLEIMSKPLTIVIIYSTALVGYLIEWGVVGFIASIMVQKAKQRLVNIKKIQEELVKKWGPEVTGDLPLDPQGFVIEKNT